MPLIFTAVYERTDNWWIAYVEELPRANTQGGTLKEARENLREAVCMVLDANRELASQHRGSGQVVHEEITA